VTKAIEKISIPTRDDISQLNKRIEELSERLKKLEGTKAL